VKRHRLRDRPSRGGGVGHPEALAPGSRAGGGGQSAAALPCHHRTDSIDRIRSVGDGHYTDALVIPGNESGKTRTMSDNDG